MNFFAAEKTAQDSADHTAPLLDNHSVSYRVNDDFTNIFSRLRTQKFGRTLLRDSMRKKYATVTATTFVVAT